MTTGHSFVAPGRRRSPCRYTLPLPLQSNSVQFFAPFAVNDYPYGSIHGGIIMYKGMFITGTDTGVGKTVVIAGLIKMFRLNKIDAVPMKPVQTGCKLQNGILDAPDLDFLLKYSDLTCNDEELRLMSSYCYEPACSPHLAGKLSGKFPDIKMIISSLKQLEKLREFVLIEGAGGIMVPLNRRDMMIDLMRKIGYPVVVVAHIGLGTINHTLLSVQTLRMMGLKVIGVIFNNVLRPSKGSEFIYNDNVKSIAEFGDVDVLGIIDYIDDIQQNLVETEKTFSKCIKYSKIQKALGI